QLRVGSGIECDAQGRIGKTGIVVHQALKGRAADGCRRIGIEQKLHAALARGGVAFEPLDRKSLSCRVGAIQVPSQGGRSFIASRRRYLQEWNRLPWAQPRSLAFELRA